jgi:hypothetical protein
MGKERRRAQVFTAEQVEGLRTYLAQKETEPPPHPETFMMGEIVRAVYPELKKLRANGYSLKLLVRVLEEQGVVITANALSTYMTKLASPKDQQQPRAVRKDGSVASSTVEEKRGQFQMKPDVTL